jgi:alpha-L-fucosidase
MPASPTFRRRHIRSGVAMRAVIRAFRFGIIGLGSIAHLHATAIQAMTCALHQRQFEDFVSALREGRKATVGREGWRRPGMRYPINGRRGIVVVALLLVAVVAVLRAGANRPSPALAPQAAAAAPAVSPAETPERAARMRWFREAKFGLFVHWGLYAIPAGEWKGQPVAGIGEWIMNRAKIPVKEYEQLAAQFNPVKFNADAWVQLAIDAGMKYIVITSKHHDGFAMYRSKVSPYNIVDATPFKRDVLAELAAACKKRGIRLGFYYSQAQDWHEPNGAGNTWDFGADDQKDFDQYLRGKAEPQVRELLTGYGPISLIWFDTPRMMNAGDRAKRFIDLLRELQPECLIDGRLGTQGDYRSMGDNRIPQTVVTEDWEVPATLNKTWGFKKDDTEWKPPSDLIFKLVDIVSKGGNYLLNVGPTAEGVIPQASQDNLRAVGGWLKVNGEAIYGAKPTPFGDELGGFGATEKDKDGKPIFIAREAWRCTAKPGKLYVHLFKWPGTEFTLTGVKAGVKRAYLLADPARKPLPLKTAGDSVVVTLPAAPVGDYATVVCLETDGAASAKMPPPATSQAQTALKK